MDEEEFQEYMKNAASEVTDPESRYKLFDAMLELSLADKSLDDLETNVLGNMSQYLEIPIHYFADNLAYHVKSKRGGNYRTNGWDRPQEPLA